LSHGRDRHSSISGKQTVSTPCRFASKATFLELFLAALRDQSKVSQQPQEASMKRAFELFASLGLFSRKLAGPDPFDLRLERTRTREARREAKRGLFKTQSEPRAV
jgi:hypothetical protein